MLPLWIIDITGNRTRREAFVSLVSKIEHVHISKTFTISSEESSDEVSQPTEDSNLPTNPQEVSPASIVGNTKDYQEDKSCNDFLSQQELLDKLERRTAEKNAIIKGDYWYYSAFDNVFSGMDLTTNEHIEGKDGVAEQLYKFQNKMVDAGKEFIRTLRCSNAKPYQTINIIVLADATEQFAQTVFPSIAAILQKEKGRFLPAHIHQGMCIYGALYVPCDINTLEVQKRNCILRLLNEVEAQHNLKEIRGYDHVMLYQNVQNRTECTYSLMEDQNLAEYLLQCLIHMFYACDATHPLISGTTSNDKMYFSMGAASLYFDMKAEDTNDASRLAAELTKCLKKESEEGALDRDEIFLLKEEEFDAEKFIHDINIGLTEKLPDIMIEGPSPHPVLNYLQKNLKRLYYFYYLRFFPARLLRKISDVIEKSTSDLLDRISIRSTKMYKNCEMALLPAIARIISKVNASEGALAAIDRQLSKLQEKMSFERDNIRVELEHYFWDKLMDSEENIIPVRQKDYFEEYHEAYKSDIASHNGGSGQQEMKSQTTEKLLDLLSAERTTLATVCRTFLLSIMCVLAILPVLSLLSPVFIDLGDVRANAYIWAIVLFMIPVLIQVCVLLWYVRKKNMLIRVLKAYYSHDAYARLANRIEFEAGDFYNKLLALCDAYLARSKRIREEVMFIVPDLTVKMPLPDTQFNQPLRGGKFDDDEVMPMSEVEGCRIRVNFHPELITNLNSTHYYLLINRFNDEIAELYHDVRVVEEHGRRFNEDTHEYEFISKEQLLQEQEQLWQNHKKEFKILLLRGIKEEMLPRESPTIGEKLLQYKKKSGNIFMLDSMIDYAAANGEIICDSDMEYSDVKINKDLTDLLRALPSKPQLQCAEYDALYKRYLFITRWRSFDHFSYNRILPTEDFDQLVRNECVFNDEQKELQRKKKEEERRQLAMKKSVNGTTNEAETIMEEMDDSEYIVHMSALILWAVCPDDTSGEWMKLFEPQHFGKAFEDRQKIRKIMNQDD